MNTPELKKGDRARVTIDGIVTGFSIGIDLVSGSRVVHLDYAAGRRSTVFVQDEQDVTVERLAPAEWPPRPGDLWRDKHGDLWFFYSDPTDEDVICGRTAGGARWSVNDFDDQLADNAPWTLVRRDESADGTS